MGYRVRAKKQTIIQTKNSTKQTKVSIELYYKPATPLMGMHVARTTKRRVLKNICTSMFTAASFTTVYPGEATQVSING